MAKINQQTLTPFLLHSQCPWPIDWEAQFKNSNPVDLEIGFGNGEFLTRMAQQEPNRNFVGIEQSWEGIKNFLKDFQKKNFSLDKAPISNLRILKIDVREALYRFFLPQSLGGVYCLFPCPWPKSKHEKHRLFSSDFFKLVNSRLAPQGRVLIVTDYKPYHNWVVENIGENGFSFDVRVIPAKYNTKYERKWFAGGQTEFYELSLTKQKHMEVLLKEGFVMKVYNAPDFNPAHFQFEDFIHPPTTVILKDFIFDKDKKKGLVHLVVSEETLTQHFWTTIEKKAQTKGWSLHPSEGVFFIPTEGIHKALELVYESVLKSINSLQKPLDIPA